VKTTLTTLAAIGVLTLAGCSSGSGSPSSATDGSGTSASTVAVRDAGGGQIGRASCRERV